MGEGLGGRRWRGSFTYWQLLTGLGHGGRRTEQIAARQQASYCARLGLRLLDRLLDWTDWTASGWTALDGTGLGWVG